MLIDEHVPEETAQQPETRKRGLRESSIFQILKENGPGQTTARYAQQNEDDTSTSQPPMMKFQKRKSGVVILIYSPHFFSSPIVPLSTLNKIRRFTSMNLFLRKKKMMINRLNSVRKNPPRSLKRNIHVESQYQQR